MKRIAAILLSFTVLLVHPAATALGQEPDIAIPVGAVAADSELRTAVGGNAGAAQPADSQAVDSQETGERIGDTQAVEVPSADTRSTEAPSTDSQPTEAPSADTQAAVQIAAPSAVLMEASTGQVI